MKKLPKKKQNRAALRRFAEAIDMPSDLIFCLPKFIITGSEEIYIENYRGIISYSESEIKINTSKFPVKISGDKMFITQIAAEEITISGKIKSVEFC